MIPFLTYPLALIALASLPALAAIYLLRNRFRRRQVSSLMLWRFQVQSKAGGAKIQRLHLPWLFFLELLALLLLVVAATGPRWKLPQSTRPLIVVLDDSFAMRAMDGGVSAQARATKLLEGLFRRQPPPSTRLILAGPRPRSLGAVLKNWREVESVLAQWKCWAPDSALDVAITLAAELGKQQANILVLTDHPPADGKVFNPRLEWRALGAPLDNLAIVNASRTAFGEQDRCLIEVANFSNAAHTTRISLEATAAESARNDGPAPSDPARIRTTSPPNVARNPTPVEPGPGVPELLSLGAHESRRLVFNLPSSAPALRVALDADALAADNEVQLLPPIRKRVRVQVGLTNEAAAALVERTLAATGLRAALSEQPELVIRETDAVVGDNSWCLSWCAAGATNAYTGPFIVDDAHPLAGGVGLQGVLWAGASLTNLPGEAPVVLAGNVPLLSVREDVAGRRHVRLNFNPALSTLQGAPDWPVLWWNLLAWRIAEMPGLPESNARLGTEVIVKTGGQAVALTRPDGDQTVFAKTGGELALETPLPGIYTVSMGTATNQFSVNLLAADKSDLAGCASGQWGRWSEDAERRLEESSAVWLFGLVALGLLAAHLYLVAAAKGTT